MPTPESDALLELAALNSEGWVTRSFDIVEAFSVGKNRARLRDARSTW